MRATVLKSSIWILLLISFTSFLCLSSLASGTETEKTSEKNKILDFGDAAWKATYGAGSAAANASFGALVTTAKTFEIMTMGLGYSAKTFVDLGKPLWQATQKASPGIKESGETIAVPVGYSTAETKVRCKDCGQQTTIRGNLPGLVITCPSCGKKIRGLSS